MKIIATVRENVFLVETTKEELGRVAGLDYYKTRDQTFQLGTVVNVSAIFERFHELVGQRKRIKDAKKEIDKINESLNKLETLTPPETAQ